MVILAFQSKKNYSVQNMAREKMSHSSVKKRKYLFSLYPFEFDNNNEKLGIVKKTHYCMEMCVGAKSLGPCDETRFRSYFDMKI